MGKPTIIIGVVVLCMSVSIYVSAVEVAEIPILPWNEHPDKMELKPSVDREKRQVQGLEGQALYYMVITACHSFIFGMLDDTANETTEAYFKDGTMEIAVAIGDSDTYVTKTVSQYPNSVKPTFWAVFSGYSPCDVLFMNVTMRSQDGSRELESRFSQQLDCPCDEGTEYGDPHAKSLDGLFMTGFNGKCSYILLEDICHGLFQILARNSKLLVRRNVRKVETIIFHYLGQTVEIDALKIKATVNGNILLSQDSTTLYASETLLVTFVHSGWVVTTLPHEYITIILKQHKVTVKLAPDHPFQDPEKNHPCLAGIFGNDDGDKENDMMLPNGQQAKSFLDFQENMIVPGSCEH